VGSGSEASENIFKIGGVQESMSQSHAKQRIETVRISIKPPRTSIFRYPGLGRE
jgi:hypothetical protein